MSIGLHGLLLWLPTPETELPETVVPDAEPEVVQVVTLPQVAPVAAAENIDAPPAVAPPPVPVAPPPPEPQPEPEPPPVVEAVPPAELDPPPLDPAPLESLPPEPAATVPLTLAQRLADVTQYSYSADSTTTDVFFSVDSPLAQWSAELSKTNSALTPKPYRPDPPIVVTSPVCPDPQPVSEVYVGVVVTPEGGVDSAPATLMSSGYDVLNEQARQLAGEYPYPATGNVEAYQVVVAVTAACS
ncbi:MAG: hypothetical protein AAFZ80_10840 [Cyanobacteria bacterium P01_A01_bin.105]